MKRILVKRIRSNGLGRFYSSKPPKKITPILKPKQDEHEEEPIEKVKEAKPIVDDTSKELKDGEKETHDKEIKDSEKEGDRKDRNANRNSKSSKNLVRKFNRILPNLKIKSAKVSIPTTIKSLLAIPLQRRPLFPGFYKSLYIKDPKVIKIIQDLMKNQQPFIGIFMAKECEDDLVMDMNDVEKVGVFAQITNTYQTGPDNSLTVVVYPHRRIRMTDLKLGSDTITIDQEPDTASGQKDQIVEQDEQAVDQDNKMLQILTQNNAPIATIENLEDEKFSPENRLIKATTAEIITVFKELSQSNPLLRDQIITHNVQSNNVLMDPAKLADFAAALSGGEPHELQGILESLVVEERLHKSLVVLKKELANAKLQQEISQEVDRKISRKNQEYFLMEQLKGIKKELGLESDGKEKLLEKFRQKAAGLEMPENIKSVFDEEMIKLQGLEQQGSEFNVTRNYLDWLTQIPWGKKSLENYDLAEALKVLNQDHYGLKDVKDRILEFIAIGNLRGSVQGKIITMVGPPGVGKTSVGKSIARALGREFYRFSVGGLTDVAEIKGHRRTYVGAMPGKVIQALKKVKTQNPLIMIDEIDKVGRGHQGDPASALLELLDPEQNNSFLDHYMDVPVDLSQVLFVCTANTLDTIPGPLLDRMEIITLSGYVTEEKIAIASKYLSPAAIKECGLENKKVNLKPDALEKLIKYYCRENGVRNLKKHIDKIYRKAAYKIVKEEKEDIVIDVDNLKEYVGSPVFDSDRMYETTPPGVIMGLAWTQMGGTSLFIESVLESSLKDEDKGSFHRTGQLGDVMKESSNIAYTYAKSLVAKKFPKNTFFDHAKIHMHVPEGATKKDGPSAGCTMTTSLLSLALNKPCLANVAMTGEITLTGKILKIGGLKEKAIAAKRTGVKTIIFPKSNRSDWDELPDYLKEGLDAHFVAWYDEIFDIVF